MMKQSTDPRTWEFLLPSFWANRIAEAVSGYFEKPDRVIDTGWIHCSASDNPKHDNVETIRRWHMGRGWSDIGYHYFISTEPAEVHDGRPVSRTPAAQKGHNKRAIAICVSGKDLEKFTEAQFDRLRELVHEIDAEVGPLRWRGHREVSRKACPVFDFAAVLNLDTDGFVQPRLEA